MSSTRKTWSLSRIWPKRLSDEQRLTLDKAMKIAKGAGYKVREYRQLSQKQLKKLGLD